MYQVMNLKQNSPDWHAYRKIKIGASDAPIIMGVSPYKTVKQLFTEKTTGESTQFEHAGMRRGHELEPQALALLNERYKSKLESVVLQSDIHPYLIASLDGFDPTLKIAVEIKCPNASDHELAKLGEVPAKYYPQLQHQLMVSGLNEIVYCSFRDYDLVTVVIKADREYQQEMLEREKLFYKSLCTNELDEVFAPKIVENHGIDSLFEELQRVRAEIKALTTPLQEREDALKQAILALANNQSISTQTCSVIKRSRTSYDYKTMAKDYNCDLTIYKKESVYFDIRERKDEG